MNGPLDRRPACARLRSALRRGRVPLGIAVVAGVALLAGSAEACPVCFQAKNDASRVAFIATTGFLTGLPLLLVGGLAWWLRRQFRKAERREPARHEQPAGPPCRDAARPVRVVASL